MENTDPSSCYDLETTFELLGYSYFYIDVQLKQLDMKHQIMPFSELHVGKELRFRNPLDDSIENIFSRSEYFL